ncbi:MAG TPA: long-chain fatty acid--CoA ligase [Thermoflexia bacterium]|nr:MAG: fatty acid--CoA ligase [Chloroflexota bacterium]HEY67379.1 long-chain fatty acid--CoA ligase [Thermoflexia bacterium]
MTAYNFQLLLKHVLEHGVAWAPDQEIVYRDQVRHTYTTMYQRVLRLAGALQSLDVKQGTKVGVIEWDSHRYLEMYFGIPGIGAVLHTINPRLAPEDLIYTMMHAEDEVLIFHEDFLPLVEKARPRLPSIRKYILITDKPEKPDIKGVDVEYEELLASASPLEELPDLDENTQATLAYTTGTTGRPKGVYFTQRQLSLHTLNVGLAVAAYGNYGGVNKHDVYMPLTPMFHVHAWGIPYMATLFGVKQVYPGRYEPEMLLRLVLGEKVTFSHCVPSILQMIVTAPAVKGLDLSGWKVVIGGARLPKGLAMAATKLGIKVYAGYGLSETCPVLTLAHLKPFMENEWDEEKQLDWAIKTGFVAPLVKLRVVTPDGREVARDSRETGEIVVRAPWCTPGYYKDPERSEELWAGGWMHTGDVAHVDEYGYIQIVDRLKDLIKSGGEWIVSLELENLLSLHEDVLEAAVIGVPDEKWGERPLAVIVPVEGAEGRITSEAMQQHLQKFVADGVLAKWAVPDYYVFVDEMPKTSVGKIDKKVLRSRYPAPPTE